MDTHLHACMHAQTHTHTHMHACTPRAHTRTRTHAHTHTHYKNCHLCYVVTSSLTPSPIYLNILMWLCVLFDRSLQAWSTLPPTTLCTATSPPGTSSSERAWLSRSLTLACPGTSTPQTTTACRASLCYPCAGCHPSPSCMASSPRTATCGRSASCCGRCSPSACSPTSATPTRRSSRWSDPASCCLSPRTAPGESMAWWWSVGTRSRPGGRPSVRVTLACGHGRASWWLCRIPTGHCLRVSLLTHPALTRARSPSRLTTAAQGRATPPRSPGSPAAPTPPTQTPLPAEEEAVSEHRPWCQVKVRWWVRVRCRVKVRCQVTWWASPTPISPCRRVRWWPCLRTWWGVGRHLTMSWHAPWGTTHPWLQSCRLPCTTASTVSWTRPRPQLPSLAPSLRTAALRPAAALPPLSMAPPLPPSPTTTTWGTEGCAWQPAPCQRSVVPPPPTSPPQTKSTTLCHTTLTFPPTRGLQTSEEVCVPCKCVRALGLKLSCQPTRSAFVILHREERERESWQAGTQR